MSKVYDHQYYTTNFKIPEAQVEAFIVYVESNNFDTSLLDKNNEMQLIEHLNKKSKAFLSKKNEQKN